MSRVERHKDEYSREDRKALENSRPAGNSGDTGSEYGAGSASTDSSWNAGTNAGQTQSYGSRSAGAGAPSGRAARNAAPAQKEDLGIWDQTEEEKKRARKEARAMGDGRPEFHGGRVIGRFISFIGTILLIAAIAACLALSVPRFAGIDQYVVISGSMEPAIPVGSMVYSAQTEPSTLDAGDVIVFYAKETGNTPVTHRVVENHIGDGEVITKGDANAQNDLSPVTYSSILGKMVLHIPMLGYLAAPIATTMGKVAMGCVILAAYLLTAAGSRLSGRR